MNDKIYEEMDMWKFASDERNSMSYWWPKIRDLDVNQPITVRIELDKTAMYSTIMNHNFNDDIKRIVKNFEELLLLKADHFGYPVFMRTSEVSAKHHWKTTCYVESREKLIRNFWTLLEENYLAIDKMPDAVFLRQFIPMESYFTGWYNEFPVNKEVRTFIRDGRIECQHPYWPKGAMIQAKPKDPDWEEKFEKLRDITPMDAGEINGIVDKVRKVFNKEWWSVDCSKGEDGKWYLIDMALGVVSAHFDCEHIPKVKGQDGN